MANRDFANSRMYTGHVMPVLIDCNFIVDSFNGNLLGIRSLKGPYVKAVYMQALINGGGVPPGSPPLATSATYAVIGASTVTNTGTSVLTGNLGLYPGTSLIGFPPGVVIGTINVANAFASQAEIDATTAYNYMRAQPATAISADLDGQTLGPGVYTETSGTFNLATSGNATLTLNGSATSVWIFNAASTITTGAGGTPTILLTGGALASNVYWSAGSSATLNVSGTGTFIGTVISEVSTTIDGGAATGRLFALTGAVTISAATAITVPASSGGVTHVPGTPAPGTIVIELWPNFNRIYTGGNAVVSPIGSTTATITAGTAYIVTSLGTTTAAQWIAAGIGKGIVSNGPNGLPGIGTAFIAALSETIPGAPTVAPTAAGGSTIATFETVGDTNQALAPDWLLGQGYGGQIILQTRNYSNMIAAPADGSVISLSFLLSNSSVTVMGE